MKGSQYPPFGLSARASIAAQSTRMHQHQEQQESAHNRAVTHRSGHTGVQYPRPVQTRSAPVYAIGGIDRHARRRSTLAPMQLRRIAVLAVAILCLATTNAPSEQGTIHIHEEHDLPNIATLGDSIECTVVIIRFVDLLDTGVVLQLSIEEEYSNRFISLDVEEVEDILASLQVMSDSGMALLAEPIFDGEEQTSSELRYTMESEDFTLVAFISRDLLRFAIKIDRSDWNILAPAGVRMLASNLQRTVAIARAVEDSG